MNVLVGQRGVNEGVFQNETVYRKASYLKANEAVFFRIEIREISLYAPCQSWKGKLLQGGCEAS